MKVAVVGTGYVGLVTGVCFADLGHDVTCIDKDAEKIAKLDKGESPIYEPGLNSLITNNIKAGRIAFTTDVEKGVAEADAVFIAVGTPASERDGQPDLAQLDAVLAPVACGMKDGGLLVIKSTVPIGTTRRITSQLKSFRPDAHLMAASNPEFLRQGNAVEDFLKPDRIVAGVDDPKAREIIEELYAPLVRGGIPLLICTFESSEMIKYASNTMLAAKIAFVNEIADICEKVSANIRDVAYGVGLDNRIGEHFLQAGPGFGGSCFPKDTIALKAIADEHSVPAPLVDAVITSNVRRKFDMVEKIIRTCGGSVEGKTIGVLGLTFKPGTDDMRESVALVLIPELIKAGAKIRAYDPQGVRAAQQHMPPSPTLEYVKDALAAVEGADACVVVTEWNEFKTLEPEKIGKAMKSRVMIDLRNIFRRRKMREAGFHYVSIGRAEVSPENKLPLDLVVSN